MAGLLAARVRNDAYERVTVVERTAGPTPPGASLFDIYFSRLIRQAHTDHYLSEAVYRVVGTEVAPTDLPRPATIRRTVTP